MGHDWFERYEPWALGPTSDDTACLLAHSNGINYFRRSSCADAVAYQLAICQNEPTNLDENNYHSCYERIARVILVNRRLAMMHTSRFLRTTGAGMATTTSTYSNAKQPRWLRQMSAVKWKWYHPTMEASIVGVGVTVVLHAGGSVIYSPRSWAIKLTMVYASTLPLTSQHS